MDAGAVRGDWERGERAERQHGELSARGRHELLRNGVLRGVVRSHERGGGAGAVRGNADALDGRDGLRVGGGARSMDNDNPGWSHVRVRVFKQWRHAVGLKPRQHLDIQSAGIVGGSPPRRRRTFQCSFRRDGAY